MKKLTTTARKRIAKAILDSDYDFDTMMRAIPSGVVGDQVMTENELFDGLIYWAQSNIKAGGAS